MLSNYITPRPEECRSLPSVLSNERSVGGPYLRELGNRARPINSPLTTEEATVLWRPHPGLLKTLMCLECFEIKKS